MNYIKQLEQDNRMLRHALDNVDTQVCLFLQFLNSPKFVGVESDGGRKDWISTGDVIHKLVDLRLACVADNVRAGTISCGEDRRQIKPNAQIGRRSVNP